MAHQLLELGNEADPELPRPLLAHVRVVRDQVHAEGEEALRDEHADASEPDDAERLAVELDPLPARAVPLPRPRSASALGTLRACASRSAIVCSAADSTFDCGAFTTITPRPRCRGDVDVVEADPGSADDDELTPGLQHRRRSPAWRERMSERRRARHGFEQLVGAEPEALVDLETRGAERIESAWARRSVTRTLAHHLRSRPFGPGRTTPPRQPLCCVARYVRRGR